eukprot:NODE_142_length_17801_cov_0.377020.p3 type:complete len:839 gc:universal NODE_142_length_17801_cov_0.377020:7567-10083(+)
MSILMDPTTQLVFGIVGNILDVAKVIVDRVEMMKENNEESGRLHFQITSLYNIIKAIGEKPASEQMLVVLDKTERKLEDINTYLDEESKRKKLKKFIKAGDFRQDLNQFIKDLEVLCSEITMHQGIGIKGDTNELINSNAKMMEKIEEVLRNANVNQSKNVYDNSEIQKMLMQQFSFSLKETQKMKEDMAILLSASKTLVEASQLAATKKEIIEKSPPFEIDYLKDILVDDSKECGSGSFGTVYKTKWKGVQVAVKKLNDIEYSDPNMSKLTSTALKNNKVVLSEIKAYQKLQNCPYIVRFYGITSINKCLSLVTEYINNNSLSHWLYEDADKALTPAIKAGITFGIAQGLLFLHERNLVHNDIKSNNIMLDIFWTPKLIDFGMAKVSSASSMSSTVGESRPIGTPAWKALELWVSNPKILKKFPYSSDVYSYSIVLGEIYTQMLPWLGCDKEGIKEGVKAGHRPYDEDDDIPVEVYTLMTRCWVADPAVRYRMEQVVHYLSENHITDSFEELAPKKADEHKIDSAKEHTEESNNPMQEHSSTNYEPVVRSVNTQASNNIKSKSLEVERPTGATSSQKIETTSRTETQQEINAELGEIDSAALLNSGMKFYYSDQAEYAIELFGKSADLGNDAAIDKLKSIYTVSMSKDDNEKSKQLIRRGIAEFENRNFQKSVLLFVESATLGNADAYFRAAEAFSEIKDDNSQYNSMKWYRISSVFGNTRAMCSLASFLESKRFYNIQGAVYWYKKGANSGSLAAMEKIGNIYMDGTKVVQNYKEAKYWYEKAVALDPSNSQSANWNLGRIYENGFGISKNIRLAIEHYRNCGDRGKNDLLRLKVY